MNWHQWKRGLLIAIATGMFSALAGLAIGLTWQQILILFALNIGKDGGLYIAQHPADAITDTQHFYASKTTTIAPPDGSPPVSTKIVTESSTVTTKTNPET
jgi:hypothetical protein